ncbi:twin-arginine translocase TatA/TatE family subunit [Cumulibacter soli]|uniref:twin-arginine translocase TatA/TatE family subunit n=1 Tax=Cumulibacter soli TaxID=2546344 RepID=UPI001068AB7F|nr:twin-arginine translocase TatA/TatE family subunit [Cumulibacter soli]
MYPGVMQIAVVAMVAFALFGYKKLPDASRAVGRSLRIFKSELKGLQADDAPANPGAKADGAPSSRPDADDSTTH